MAKAIAASDSELDIPGKNRTSQFKINFKTWLYTRAPFNVVAGRFRRPNKKSSLNIEGGASQRVPCSDFVLWHFVKLIMNWIDRRSRPSNAKAVAFTCLQARAFLIGISTTTPTTTRFHGELQQLFNWCSEQLMPSVARIVRILSWVRRVVVGVVVCKRKE